jgi:hypothetical protein
LLSRRGARNDPRPVSSEFETGLSSGVGLWVITAGPDGNLWLTEETHNAVGRITPGAVITEFGSGFPTGSRRGSSPAPTGTCGSRWREATARSGRRRTSQLFPECAAEYLRRDRNVEQRGVKREALDRLDAKSGPRVRRICVAAGVTATHGACPNTGGIETPL